MGVRKRYKRYIRWGSKSHLGAEKNLKRGGSASTPSVQERENLKVLIKCRKKKITGFAL